MPWLPALRGRYAGHLRRRAAQRRNHPGRGAAWGYGGRRRTTIRGAGRTDSRPCVLRRQSQSPERIPHQRREALIRPSRAARGASIKRPGSVRCTPAAPGSRQNCRRFVLRWSWPWARQRHGRCSDSQARIMALRGRVLEGLAWSPRVIVTLHPSAVLRSQEEGERYF